MVKKILAILLVAVLLLATGCAAEETPAETEGTKKPTVPLPPPTQQTPTDPIDDSKANYWVDLVKDGVAQYTIVSNAPEYDDDVVSLTNSLRSKTGATFSYKTSAYKNSVTGKKILIGQKPSNVLTTDEVLTYNGKLSRDMNLTIHITGHHESAVASAIQDFLIGCLDKYKQTGENGKINFSVPDIRVFFLKNPDNYSNTTPSIFGVDLAQYQIVFPENTTGIDHFMAKLLIEEIGTNTGYVMQTVTDAVAESEYEIVFGKTTRAQSSAIYSTLGKGQYAIQSVGTKIYVAYDNYLVANDARGAFNSIYLRNNTAPIALVATPDYSANHLEKELDAFVRVMTSNIVAAGDLDGVETFEKGMGISWQDRVGLQGNMIMAYLPDFVGLQEMQQVRVNGIDANMHTELLKTVGSEYSFVPYDGATSNYWCPILYRSTVWKVDAKDRALDHFDNDMHRWQWALFSKIESPSEQYIVLNLHYPTGNNQIDQQIAGSDVNAVVKELRETYPTVPIFVTGDFNAAEGSQTYNNTVAGTTLENANTASGAIDLVLYTSDRVTLQSKYWVNDTWMQKSSDHRPFFADIF